MEINYGPEKQLAFLTSNTYNGGIWVKVEAARALRNNVETGVLRVTLNGVQEDLMDTIALPRLVLIFIYLVFTYVCFVFDLSIKLTTNFSALSHGNSTKINKIIERMTQHPIIAKYNNT